MQRMAQRHMSAVAHPPVKRVDGPSREQLVKLFGKEGLPNTLSSRGHDNSKWKIATYLTVPACLWATYNAYKAEEAHFAAHPHGQELPEWLKTGTHRKDFFWGDGKTPLFDHLIPFETKQRIKKFLFPRVKVDDAAKHSDGDEEEDDD